ALTFISVPATAYGSDFWMLQLAAGYVIGRVAVAALLLPGYFRGETLTAYALLERRFGPGTRRFASVVFLVTRILADGVRVFAAAAPGKMRILHPAGGFASPSWLLTGVVGGAFLSMASHGVDHLIVQRLLASRSLGDARRALVTSGVVVFAQFALFLCVGLGL